MKIINEIIFDIPSDQYGEYRGLCQYNMEYPYRVWWIYLQKKISVTKRKWFKKYKIDKWIEIDSCWLNNNIDKREQLEYEIIEMYKRCVEIPIKLFNTAINL